MTTEGMDNQTTRLLRDQLDRANALIRNLGDERDTIKADRDHLHTRGADLQEQLRLAADATRDLQLKYDRLAQQLQEPVIEGLRQELRDLHTEHEETERRLHAKAVELTSFKQEVVAVAAKFAEQYDLCDNGLRSALSELGLELHPNGYQAEATITIKFHTTMTERRELPDEGWVLSSMRQNALRAAIERNFEMDADHKNTSVDDITIEVADVDEREVD